MAYMMSNKSSIEFNDHLIGNWENDKANGYGEYTHANGSKYSGDWLDDKQHGIGRETW